MNIIQQAKALEDLGFRIVPVEGKVAASDGFSDPDFSYPYHGFGDADAIGVLCGPCPALGEDWLLCLDLDGDWQECAQIQSFVDALPDTLSSHGWGHLFFRVPPGPQRDALKQWTDVFRTKKEHGAALDLRWGGGYAVERWDWDTDLLIEEIAVLPADALQKILDARVDSVAPARAPLAAGGSGSAKVLDWALEWLRDVAPVAIEGRGGSAKAFVTFGGLVVGFGLDEDTAVELAQTRPPIAAGAPDAAWNDRCEPPWSEAELYHKAQEAERKGSTRFEPNELVQVFTWSEALQALWEEFPPVREAIQSPDGTFPEMSLDGTHLNPATGWPYILKRGDRCWYHRLDAPGYSAEFPAADLTWNTGKFLTNQVDDAIRAKKALLLDHYVGAVTEVRSSYLTEYNTYDPKDHTLTLAALRWGAHESQPHPEVDRWLRAIAGEDYDLLAQWLASCVALDRPSPCLYLWGEANIGKSLLAHGIAAIWKSTPCTLAETTTNYNDGLASCPLLVAEEALPRGLDFNTFKEMLTAPVHHINPKYGKKSTVHGHIRMFFAANNKEGFRYQRTGKLDPSNRDAIAQRLLTIQAMAGAGAVLEDIFRRVPKGKFADTMIPEHILWLAETVSLEPLEARTGVRAKGGSAILSVVSAMRSEALIEALCSEEARASDPKTSGLKFDPEAGEVLLNVAKFKTWVAKGDKSDPEARDVRDFCDEYTKGPSRKVRMWGNRTTSPVHVRVLDLKALEAAASELE